MKRFLKLFSVMITAVLFATGAIAQDKPRIVAVNYALQYLAERLAGDAAEVVFPVPSDVDPSFWSPSIADISAIQSADLILLNGAGFAAWIDRVSLPRSKLVNTTAAIKDRFIVTESITHSHGDGGEHSHEGLASYTWLDPSLAIAQAEAIAAAMSRRNIDDPDTVYKRLGDLTAELESFDQQTATALSPVKDVAMIATHPRYQYFARRYGLSIASLEWEAGATPSTDELDDLKTLVAETGAKVLIWEATPAQEALEAASALGLKNVIFNPLAHADEDQDYVGSLAASVKAIAGAAQ